MGVWTFTGAPLLLPALPWAFGLSCRFAPLSGFPSPWSTRACLRVRGAICRPRQGLCPPRSRPPLCRSLCLLPRPRSPAVLAPWLSLSAALSSPPTWALGVSLACLTPPLLSLDPCGLALSWHPPWASRRARALAPLRVATDPAPHRSRSCAAGPAGTRAAARPRALGCPLSHISYQAPRTIGPSTGCCVGLPTSLTGPGPSVAPRLIVLCPGRSPLAFPPETFYFCLGLSPAFATSSPPLPYPSLPRVLGYPGSPGSLLPPCDPLYSVSRVSSLNLSVPAVLRLCLGVAPLVLSSLRRAALPVPCLDPGPGPPGLPHCCLRWQDRADSSIRGSLRALHSALTRAAGSLLTQCFRPRTSSGLQCRGTPWGMASCARTVCTPRRYCLCPPSPSSRFARSGCF